MYLLKSTTLKFEFLTKQPNLEYIALSNAFKLPYLQHNLPDYVI